MACPHPPGEGSCPQCTLDATLVPTMPLADPIAMGGQVGRYVVLAVLGRGGMGVVYKAHDPQLDRLVAIKLLRAGVGGSTGQARLLREAQVMAQLSHPNVVPVFDVGTHGDGVFVAMELVKGIDLKGWLAQQPRSSNEILEVFVQAGRGLVAAHEAGLVHRDFKPANVLLGEDGRARVADFGLARSTLASDRAEPPPGSGLAIGPGLQLQSSVGLVGTPAYMAPEQFEAKAVSSATDQFAFCVALYEALYGVLPFVGGTLAELSTAVRAGRVPPAPRGSGVPAHVHRALERGLSVDPALRHASMSALVATLSTNPAQVLRRRLAISAVALTLVAGGTFIAWTQHQQTRACRGAEQTLEGRWDAALRDRAERAFAATGRPYAKAAWAHARDAMDDYARRWVAARKDTCAATRIRGEQTEAQLALRMTCLDRRLDELGGLASGFAHADLEVVDQAAAAVARLTPLDGCARIKSLEDRKRVPPEAKDAVEHVGRQLALARALSSTGKFTAAREKLEVARAEATRLSLPGPQAEAYAALADLELQAGNWAASREAYEQAVRFAEAAHDDEATAHALATLVSLVGWRLERPTDARMLGRFAAGILERMGGDERLEALLAESLGDAEWAAGAHPASLEQYRAALQTLLRLEGPQSTDVARLRSAVGWVLMGQGEVLEARAQLEQSLSIRQKLLGAEHPALASSWNELGSLADSLGDYPEAVRCMERAKQIALLTFDQDSPALARRNLALASAYRDNEQTAEGFAVLREARAVLDRHPDARVSERGFAQVLECDLEGQAGRLEVAQRLCRDAIHTYESGSAAPHFSAQARLALAGILMRQKDYAGSLESYDRYLALEEQQAQTNSEYALGLAESAAPLAALGRTSQALARLDRAVALLPFGRGFDARAAWVRFLRAQVLAQSDAPRARALATEAVDRLPPGKRAEQVRAWLARP